jgi:hypothetical protein
VAYTIDEEGTLIPVRRDGVSEPPPDPERTLLNITEYRYEYDQYGNWTERTMVFREVVDSSESGGHSTVDRRTLVLLRISDVPVSVLAAPIFVPLGAAAGGAAGGVWSKISSVLKRFGFRSHDFITQLLSEP